MSDFVFQALQAPACHENMVKVGGYILGEFGNLIAGDPRSRYQNFTEEYNLFSEDYLELTYIFIPASRC